ncbi:SDR family NAD(P)-dependent oxidoreductase [Flavobacterium selenitireducens]|uniref:SDR family NAD(P)-dependent oxidoreductase n=1 Tax=Flavobacterium selenitireducens TaxID=2722704 RepID=UPI00168BC659|nr:3-oxoacyl-ACP reductase family protein [Flavobacterium selenitireducens]MBD3581348.1 3-oxoacyl-ACP reductase FabG [Flavobacterium selenitireducens]
MKLEGKIAFVTGADSGIGQAIALAFASEGADVAICYHTDRKGILETETIVKKTGRRALVLKIDVSKEKQVENALDKVVATFGKVDIIVNNAAVNGSNVALADMKLEQFDTVMKTNLYSVFFATRWLARRAGSSRGSKIINISSIHEDIATPGNTDYNSSKGALRMFTRSMALELAPFGITVNNIAPGMILTPMNQLAVDSKSIREEKSGNIPLHRPGEPIEIARLAVFLASTDSDYVTGTTYTIDGGLSLRLGHGA